MINTTTGWILSNNQQEDKKVINETLKSFPNDQRKYPTIR